MTPWEISEAKNESDADCKITLKAFASFKTGFENPGKLFQEAFQTWKVSPIAEPFQG